MITPERVYEVFDLERRMDLLNGSRDPFLKSSPEMLVDLVKSTLSMIKYGEQFTDPRFNKFLVDIEQNVKAIESADSKNRPWPEILKELEE